MNSNLTSFLGCVFSLVFLLPSQGEPQGLSGRVANTTLRMPPSSPVFGYSTERAFGSLVFNDPVAIVSPPGESNRLFIVEQVGRITVITNLANPNRTVFLDISGRVHAGGEEGLLGLTFHPGYSTNGYFYVFYTLYTNAAAGASSRHDRLARFARSPHDPDRALVDSEVVLISQQDDASNHNGGDLHFGPDGYLYVSLGDEGGGNDSGNNSQRIDKDFFAGILRIDVDKRPGSLAPNTHPASTANYAIPSDNPFVGASSFNGQAISPAKVRTEFWAVGLRNPWRIFFDRPTGRLYCADVGQNAWEEIDIITKGGNYGWAYREGLHAGPGTPPGGFTSIPPILEYAHGSGNRMGYSVTGGVVYRGNRIAELNGAYVFGDYVSGNIWATRYDGNTASPMERLTGITGISAFGIDPANGDILMADLQEDTIKRLVFRTLSSPPLPPTLADTGAFANLVELTPNAGIVPYEVNVPFWSDNAIKSRWFSVPDVNAKITFRAATNWAFPAGTVWIKHFELEMTRGVAASRRRVETRFLVRDATAKGVYGVTYRWADSQTNAALVQEQGMDEVFTIQEENMTRSQNWRYPSRSQCLACHTVLAGGVLGFNTPQLNRDCVYQGVVDNQIGALNRAGYFLNAVSNLNQLRRLADATDETVSVEYRVRSYLMANCAQCHRPGGLGLGFFDAGIYNPLSTLHLIEGKLNEQGNDESNRVISPGSLARSMLLRRISAEGPGRMPPLASTVLDTQAIALMSRWITNDLVGYQSFAGWQIAHFSSTQTEAAQAGADPDRDAATNYQEYLAHTDPLLASEFWGLNIERSSEGVEITYPRLANRGFEIQWTTDPAHPATWRFLDHPDNRPLISATNGVASLTEVLSPGPFKFYRARIFEP